MSRRTRSHPDNSLFRPGENCWKVAEAQRLAVLIDGQEYFDAFAEAAEAARHSIIILAWDFDSRALLYRSCAPRESRMKRWGRRMGARLRHRPDPAEAGTLGDFLNRLTRRNRALQIRVLIWDYPMIFGLDREFPPLYGLGWKPRRRVHVRYDNTQPTGASHHQKIVVIDGRVAFCGGLDLTNRRWDTCHHKAQEPRRVAAGAPYPPFHDTMMAVSGDAARALGELARERWQKATGETLQSDGTHHRRQWHRRWRRRRTATDPWPPSVRPQLTNVPVAVSRTLPAMEPQPGVREIEQLYLDMIARARRCIYIENQYFTAHRIGDALAARLAEPDGPELVLILRLLSHGWLEAISMEALRTRLLRRLQAADTHKRFKFYYPAVGGLPPDKCIDVHSKLIVVDDELLRVGSANLANRSMGLDTECDLTLEARGDAYTAEMIAAFRTRLLAEHLGIEPQAVAAAHARLGSLGAAIESLRRPPAALGSEEHTLQTFDEASQAADPFPGVAELADPERPVSLRQLIPQFAPTDGGGHRGPAWGRLIAIALLLAAFGAAWQWTPLSEFATAAQIKEWADRFADTWWAPLAVVIAFTPACVTMFPRPLITLFAVIAFGPWYGFALGMIGNLLAGWLSFIAGARLSPETLRRLAGPNFHRISTVLRQRGVMAVTAVRLVPLAPYAIPGMVAGAARVRPWHYMVGTFLGLLPGSLATTVFGGAMEAALEDPHRVNYWIVGSVTVVFVVGTWWVRRWLLTTRLHEEDRK